MESIPDAWPGAATPNALKLAPLFPLPNVYLFPGSVMPLHIFEPRYRQMVEDMLDGPGRLVMGTVLEKDAPHLDGAPSVLPIAGLGEIGRHERLPDGRFLIWLIGLTRVRIREVESSRLYRRVEVDALEEIQPSKQRATALRPVLQKAILSRCTEFLNLPKEMPLSYLVDLLLQRMQLPQGVMAHLYSELDVSKRADGALHEHAHRPLPPPVDPKPPAE